MQCAKWKHYQRTFLCVEIHTISRFHIDSVISFRLSIFEDFFTQSRRSFQSWPPEYKTNYFYISFSGQLEINVHWTHFPGVVTMDIKMSKIVWGGSMNSLKDSGNSSGRSATFRIIYYHKSHTFKDVEFQFSAVLGNIYFFFIMKTNCTFITQQKE